MFNWFGKKEAMDAAKGVGTFIDELNLTAEEQVKYKMHLFEAMGPFKQIQRIIVTYVMIHWLAWAINATLAVWLGYVLFDPASDDNYHLFNRFVEYAKLEMVWVPSFGVFTLYLSGGIPIFKKK